jgi:hypothetical protein
VLTALVAAVVDDRVARVVGGDVVFCFPLAMVAGWVVVGVGLRVSWRRGKLPFPTSSLEVIVPFRPFWYRIIILNFPRITNLPP